MMLGDAAAAHDPGTGCPCACYNDLRIIVAQFPGSTAVDAPEIHLEAQTAALDELLAAEGIRLKPEQVDQLDLYRRLLWSWNERMNLTRHTTLEKFVTRDVIDSQQLAALLRRGERVLDVGTGGGVPGVILAILRPDLK